MVILSLVRNHKQGRIGFLKSSNRVNVLLSRAKHGLYIFGNVESLTRDMSPSNIWLKVLEIMRVSNLVGNRLPMQCSNHPSTFTQISQPSDFSVLVGDGGCTLPCEFRLACGHQCARRCHPDDKEHISTFCLKPCQRLRSIDECPSEHICPLLCGEPCGRCIAPVEVETLPCEHNIHGVLCWETRNPSSLSSRCQELSEVVVPESGHKIVVKCCQKSECLESSLCTADCSAPLSCGHNCISKCGMCRSVSKEASKFRTKRQKAAVSGDLIFNVFDNPSLSLVGENSEGKPVNVLKTDKIIQESVASVQMHLPCTSECRRPAGCGHVCQELCHAGLPCGPCGFRCAVRCQHSYCPRPCNEVCDPCIEPCVWNCPHEDTCSAPCGAPCLRLPCDLQCCRVLSCGHPCPALCGEPCPRPDLACSLCATPESLSRVVDLITMHTLAEHKLKSDGPLIVLGCGHIYTVSTMDKHMQIEEYYAKSETTGRWNMCSKLPERIQSVKSCPDCRDPIVAVRRYGRVVNKAILDQMTQR